MEDEFQSSVFQSMVVTALFDVDKPIAEERQNIFKLVDKLIEQKEAHISEVNELYHKITDEKMAIKLKWEQMQNDISVKKQETDKIKNQILVLSEEKHALQRNIERLQELKNDGELKVLAAQVHSLKEEINLKKTNFTQKNLELLKGVSYYRRYLQCNVFESDGLVVFSLNPSAKHISQTQEYVRLKTEDECRNFQIIDYKPNFHNMEKLKEECEKTGDLQCFIRNFRKEVKLRRENNKENQNKANKKQT